MSVLQLARFGERRLSLAYVVAALLAGAVVSGCGPVRSDAKMHPPITSTCRNARQCEVPVTVDCHMSPCTITIPDAQKVMATKGFDVIWYIAPGSEPFLFKNPGGVFFKDPQAVWDCGREEHGARFRCKPRHKDETGQRYGIDLVGPKPVNVLDPWIVNR
jgi:hypothetical protein